MTRFTHLVLLKSIFAEFFTAVLRFPIIYYSTGLREVANKALAQILWLEKFFALRLSVNTLFTPLYGDYSKEGRVAGLVVRLALLIFRSLGFLISLIFISLLFILYGVLPALIIWVIGQSSF